MEVGSTSGEFRPADEDSVLCWTGEMLFNAQVYEPLKTKNMILLAYLQVGKKMKMIQVSVCCEVLGKLFEEFRCITSRRD